MAERAEVLEIVLRTKIVAVIRMRDAVKLGRVTAAISRGGVKAIEITMTVPGALDVIRTMAGEKSAGALVGAGTVLDAEMALAAIGAGADFIVSPILVPAIVGVCREAGVFVVPGAFTPTEIVTAWNLGADVVKVFPATSLGPSFFKDLRGPLPGIRLMPTGGVGLDNAPEFIRRGACCVAVGTALLDPDAIERDDWEALTRRARTLVESLAGV